MLSRRVLRLKAMQVLYGYFSGNNDNPAQAEKELMFSIQKSHHLFFHLLNLIVEIADFAHMKIDNARQKKLPTYDDLNPNSRFVENKVIAAIRSNRELTSFLTNYPYNWKENDEIVKKLYWQMLSAKEYEKYMLKSDINLNDDKDMVSFVYTEIIAKNEDIIQTLEEGSIFWNDDYEFLISSIVKVISGIKSEEGRLKIPGVFSHKEDEIFVKDIIHKTIMMHPENEKLISSFTRNWDVERIAQLDILLMEMALTEFICMDEVPVKVTLNEYIELSKYYSTEKSWAFINGVLDKIIDHLRKEKRIAKKGKGLLGEPGM
jgi:N utilization substance protein B